MIHLESEKDFEFLKYKDLVQVCVGLNQVILRFDDDIVISIETPLTLQNEAGSKITYESNKDIGKELMSLLGERIVNVSVVRPRILRLAFNTGTVVDLIEDEEPYESFHIKSKGRVIVV